MVSSSISDGDFELDADPAKGKIILHPIGHWSLDTVDRLDATFRFLVPDLQSAGRPLLLLIDLRDRTAHSQEVALRLQISFARIASSFAKVALVFPRSAIMAMQAKRIAFESSGVGEHQRQFGPDEIDSAHQWLEAPADFAALADH
jgi:hypothetical protein